MRGVPLSGGIRAPQDISKLTQFAPKRDLTPHNLRYHVVSRIHTTTDLLGKRPFQKVVCTLHCLYDQRPDINTWHGSLAAALLFQSRQIGGQSRQATTHMNTNPTEPTPKRAPHWRYQNDPRAPFLSHTLHPAFPRLATCRCPFS